MEIRVKSLFRVASMGSFLSFQRLETPGGLWRASALHLGLLLKDGSRREVVLMSLTWTCGIHGTVEALQ